MINTEKNYEYPLTLVGNDFYTDGSVKFYTYPNLIQSVAEKHLTEFSLDTAAMAAQNLAWVLVGMDIRVFRPPSVATTVMGRTWHSKTALPFFRRDFEFFDEKGVLFSGASFSVLFNLEKRSVLRGYTLPVEMSEGRDDYAIADAVRSVSLKGPFTHHGDILILPSHLDILGHVNNTRYFEFAYDAMPLSALSTPINRMHMSFARELQLGDNLGLYLSKSSDMLAFRGIRQDGQKSFDGAFWFENQI